MKKTAILLMALFSVSGFAMQKPISYPEDSRIKMVAFSENNVVPINGEVFTSTQLLFGSDEFVLDVEGGDKDGWLVTHQKNIPNMLFIKPTAFNSHSNMTVVTNKHTYYFSIQSNGESDNKSERTYAVKFVYPEDERRRLNAELKLKKREKEALINHKKKPKDYNWHYSFNGDRTIMPAHVFDDGVFTYLELREGQEVPAIFSIDNKQGEEAIVNFSRQENYLVIHRLSPQLTLRSGKHHVASIFNDKLISKIKRG